MSDAEDTKKSGYRLEYAASSRSKCQGPKPCKGTTIEKGQLRLGSIVDFRGNTSFAWRHWGCATSKVLSNMKNSFESADDLDGFDDLQDEDKDRVREAFESGKIAPEDIPESAKKQDGDEDEDEEEKPKKGRGKKKEADDGPGVFKVEYASSGRSKCKKCNESIPKDFFRLGNETDFRGNKVFQWRHWGCADDKTVEKIKASYGSASEIDGYATLQENEQEKVNRAWDAGKIPADDQGPGEAAVLPKKTAVKRKKAADDDEDKPKRSRAKKAKKSDDDDEEEEEEKPKARARKAPAAKAKAAPKKSAAKKKKADEDSGEDLADEIAAVDDEEMDEDEPEEPPKKKRAPASKASSSKPASKRASKPASRAKKVQEPISEEDDE